MPRRTIILTSVLVGIIALIGGILGIASRSTSYDATAEVSIVPKTTNVDQSISAVDTLSRGPVTSNFAEAFSSSRIVDEAFRAAGISEAEADRVSVDPPSSPTPRSSWSPRPLTSRSSRSGPPTPWPGSPGARRVQRRVPDPGVRLGRRAPPAAPAPGR